MIQISKFLKLNTQIRNVVISHWKVPFYRGTYLMSLNMIISFVSGIGFWILASRLFTPSQIGIASAFLAPINFFSTAFLLGVNHGILRFITEIERDSRLAFSLTWFVVAFCIIASAIGAFICVKFDIIYPVKGSYLLTIIIYSCAVSAIAISTICEVAFVGLRAPLQMLVRNIGFALVRILILLPFSKLGEQGLLLAYVVGFLFAASFSIDMLRRYLKLKWNKVFTFWHSSLKMVLGFAFPNHIVNLISSIPTMILPLVVFHILGAEINGYFAVAWTVTLVVRSVLTASSVTLLAEGGRNSFLFRAQLKQTTIYLLSIVGLSSMPLMLMPKIVLLPFGDPYINANSITLPLLTLSIIPTVFPTIYIASERILGRTRYILLWSIFNTVVTTIFSYIGAIKGSYLGFSIGYFISQSVMGLLVVLPLTSIYKTKILLHDRLL